MPCSQTASLVLPDSSSLRKIPPDPFKWEVLEAGKRQNATVDPRVDFFFFRKFSPPGKIPRKIHLFQPCLIDNDRNDEADSLLLQEHEPCQRQKKQKQSRCSEASWPRETCKKRSRTAIPRHRTRISHHEGTAFPRSPRTVRAPFLFPADSGVFASYVQC